MKSPSKNISSSLRGQKPAGRAGRMPTREAMGGSPSMIIPGEGDTETSPGAEGMERSAAKSATLMGNVGKL